MDKFLALSHVAVKYFFRYRRRYVFLFAALVFGFTIVTIFTSIKDGMYNNLYYSAQSHYAGDIIAVSYPGNIGEHEVTEIKKAVISSGIKPSQTVLRTIYFGVGDSVIFYNGAYAQLKYVLGCDWNNELKNFEKMSFEESFPVTLDDNSMIISSPIAKLLNIRIGDMVVLEVTTKWGQKNTGQFIIKNIVNDSSLFGYYKVYISRKSLNNLLLYDDGDCSTLGLFLENQNTVEKKRKDLQEALSRNLSTGPLVYNRDELGTETKKDWDGKKVFLLTLPVYLSEVSELLDAINIVTYCIYGLILLIILVSATVTYRLILHERVREIGIMGTIGFSGSDLRRVLWTEVTILGFFSLIFGLLLVFVISQMVSFISFSSFPGFEVFMKNGKLSPLYLPATFLINGLSVFVILFLSVIFPAFIVSRKKLPNLLSGEAI
ncbi:MAG: FtsX-like permease family protein [Spirochaetes bacterium]|nr:FtsX-like permease family protein [Spirochaetota bacterium]